MKANGTKLTLIVARNAYFSKQNLKFESQELYQVQIVLWKGMYPLYSCQCLHIGLKIFSIKQNSDKSKESWCTSKKKNKKK